MAARPAVSAHRGGAEAGRRGTCAACASALDAGADYIEFDVRQTRDGVLVASHHGRLRARAVAAVGYQRLCDLAGYPVPQVAEVLRLLAGRAGAHLDLKEPGCADAAIGCAVEVLGAGAVIVTTRDTRVARMVKRRFPAAGVGVTIGGDVAETLSFTGRALRRPGLTRLDKVLAAAADWAVVHHRLARTGVLARCRELGLKTMVWTVNSDRELARWLADPRVDVLVTDRPGRAIALRDAGP